MYRKIITILITGMVFTAGLAVSFGIPVFAGDPVPGLHIYIEQIPGGKVSTQKYGSSLSNKSAGQIRMDVGNILLGYGVGGADINKVTDALEGNGVYEAELKSFLIAIGINEEGVQGIFLKLDGIDIKSTEAVSAPDVGDTPRSKPYIKIQGIPGKAEAISTPGTKDTQRSATGCKNDNQCSAGDICFKGLCIPVPAKGTTVELPFGCKAVSGGPSPDEGEDITPLGGGDPLKGLGVPSNGGKGCNEKIELMQNTIGKIQERLKRCDTEVCITVGDHAKVRADVTIETEKAIKDGKREEAVQSLR
ncbi:MAG: hypothetical protein Q8R05_03705, partial [Candidatus Omnitrophota bacterium]|nr:hypothetical protein [Candidatus Omnitrophota bacterium]